MQEQNCGHDCHEDHVHDKTSPAFTWLQKMMPSQRMVKMQRHPGESCLEMMRRLSK